MTQFRNRSNHGHPVSDVALATGSCPNPTARLLNQRRDYSTKNYLGGLKIIEGGMFQNEGGGVSFTVKRKGVGGDLKKAGNRSCVTQCKSNHGVPMCSGMVGGGWGNWLPENVWGKFLP